MTLHLPTPLGTTALQARFSTVDGQEGEVPVSADGAAVTVTVRGNSNALLTLDVRVNSPVGSTIIETGYVDGHATNSTSHVVIPGDAPECENVPAGTLCGVGSTFGLPSYDFCWTSTTIVTQDPGQDATTVTKTNDRLAVGTVAEGCAQQIPTAPHAQDLLDDRLFTVTPDPAMGEGFKWLYPREGLADGTYTVDVEQRLVPCLLGDDGRVIACAAPFVSESSFATQTLASAPPFVAPPVTAPPVTAPPVVSPPPFVAPPVTPVPVIPPYVAPPVTPTAPPIPPTVVQAGGGATADRPVSHAVTAGLATALVVLLTVGLVGRRESEDA